MRNLPVDSALAGQSIAFEDIIQIYLRDVDRTLIRENLALTPAQRLQKLEEFVEFLESAKKAANEHRGG